jgi:hypothetical protein
MIVRSGDTSNGRYLQRVQMVGPEAAPEGAGANELLSLAASSLEPENEPELEEAPEKPGKPGKPEKPLPEPAPGRPEKPLPEPRPLPENMFAQGDDVPEEPPDNPDMPGKREAQSN